MLTPTISYENEVLVNKSVAESWAVMSDVTKLPKWLKGFKRTELVSGTENTVGAVSNIYFEEEGNEMVMKETITALSPQKHQAMSFTMDFMDMTYDMYFEEEAGQTRIRSKTTASGNGAINRSIVSLMPSTMKGQDEESLINLKKLIEINTTNYFPEPAVEEVGETVQ